MRGFGSDAPIERLPVEIVQDIFLLTGMDPNMPRASPVLSQRLNDYYILSRFCERAFAESAFTHSHMNYQQQKEERLQLQKTVFDMRWMNWSFFSWFLDWKKVHSAGSISHDMNHRRQTLERRIKPQCPWIPQIICPLPNKLLRPPYTEDKLAFIKCLLDISNASVNWASKESVRLSTLAKREAILGRNLEAVHLFSRTRRLAKAPNLELVKFAVIQGGCDRSIVFELMTAAREWGHRRWADAELDAWVARESAKGNTKSKWLKIKLQELQCGKYPDPKSGNYPGDCLVVKKSPLGGSLMRYLH